MFTLIKSDLGKVQDGNLGSGVFEALFKKKHGNGVENAPSNGETRALERG